jgi:hypothetical protein
MSEVDGGLRLTVPGMPLRAPLPDASLRCHDHSSLRDPAGDGLWVFAVMAIEAYRRLM